MTDERSPVLTVRQPWAWAISDSSKRAENRGRRMNYRGPLWLHAGARSGWDSAGQHSPLVRQAWAAYARSRPEAHQSIWLLRKDTTWMPFGAIVALVTVTDCHHASECWLSCSCWAADGQYHIQLASHVTKLTKPLTVRGMQGLWKMTAEGEDACRARVAGEKCPR